MREVGSDARGVRDDVCTLENGPTCGRISEAPLSQERQLKR